MHDVRLIRDDPAAFAAAMARRGGRFDVADFAGLDGNRRRHALEAEQAQAERNRLSKDIGNAMASGDKARAETLKARVAALKEDAAIAEAAEQATAAQLDLWLAGLPNTALPDVPDGADEHGNVVLTHWGTVTDPGFAAKEHDELGRALGMDFDAAATVSGARFVYLKGPIARLNRAIGQFMLDRQTIENGYTEVVPPLLVRDEAMFGTGQLPKFEEDLFQTDMSLDPSELYAFKHKAWIGWMAAQSLTMQTAPSLTEKEMWDALPNPPTRRWLIPTAEVSLTNAVRGEILAEKALPLRFVALTPCFRAEAGAAGRDTRGMIRQHQFEKVELVSITTPEQSDEEHERMTRAAEGVLEALGLPYRRMLLCAGDMGFAAARTFDLEVWLPGQRRYREISSCSTCTDFQARRMNTRYRPAGEGAGRKGGGTRFVHTLNGSGLAVGRTLVAVMETYQTADGAVRVPEALKPYMAGVEAIEPA